MANHDMDYDTDTISLTSTVETDTNEAFPITQILAEGMGEYDNGVPVMKYLIEWENYPMEA
jgi:hypothetical protein